MEGESNLAIKQYDGKLGTRELAALIAISIGIASTDMIPTILFSEGKNVAWMFPAIWGIVILLPLLTLLSLLKRYNLGLVELIYKLLGQYFGFIINCLLFLLAYSATILNSRNYVDIVRGVYLQETPLWVIYILIIGSSYFIANKGFETIGNLSYMIIIVLISTSALLILLLFEDYNFNNIYPIWGPGLDIVFTRSVKELTVIGEVIVISVFYKNVRSHKEYAMGSFAGLGLGLLHFTVLLLTYVFVFGGALLKEIPYPFHQATRIAGVERFFSNFSPFFLFFWLISAILKYSFNLYISTMIIGYTLRLEKTKPLLLLFSALTIILGLIPQNPVQVIQKLRSMLLIEQSWFIFIFLPIMLWIIAFIKRGTSK